MRNSRRLPKGSRLFLNRFGTTVTTLPRNCDCPDFDRITIYDGVNAADVTSRPDGSIDPSTLQKADVIYEVEKYWLCPGSVALWVGEGFSLGLRLALDGVELSRLGGGVRAIVR